MLEEEIKHIYHRFKWKKRMIIADEQQEEFKAATCCHICEEVLGNDRVRDHCHLTGLYRGASHEGCNVNYKIPKFYPVFLHNLSGYDSHLFIKNLGVSEGNISCIPNNEEKYISFSKQIIVDSFANKDGKKVDVKREIRFIDSFKFMAESLDSLVKNLTEVNTVDCQTCKEKQDCEQIISISEDWVMLGICKECHNICNKQLDQKSLPITLSNSEKTNLLARKGVFPYDWFDSLEKLNETSLPPKEAFYSKLNDEHISDEDYAHAQTVWKELNMKTMKEYHDLYLKTDVLLLADVFENFRDVCNDSYKLDPAWYFTAPGLAWDGALKRTNVKLELLSDPDMLLMNERGIRGGIATISHRYSKANNPYMNDAYDKDLPTKYIQYLDANNLYAWAMS